MDHIKSTGRSRSSLCGWWQLVNSSFLSLLPCSLSACFLWTQQTRKVSASLCSYTTSPPPSSSAVSLPLTDSPSRCVKHAVVLDMSVFSDSDDVKWQMLIVSLTLSESHRHASFLELSSSFFSLRHQLQLTALASMCVWGCFSMFVSLCEFSCSALSADFTNPADLPLRIILPQCFLHLSTTHTPSTPDLKNPILISPIWQWLTSK